jgi:hypothetical protein
MKKAIVAVLVAVLLTSGLLVGCVEGGAPGSGNLLTQEFEFSDFTRVEVGSAFQVEIAQADSYRVSVTADDNLFEYIQVSKEGETLKIGLKLLPLRPLFNTLRAEISMPQIDDLGLSGATRGTVSGFNSTENLDIEVSGASSLDLVEMSAGDIKLELSGASRVSGNITASGDARFELSGASSVELQGSANDMLIEASGASQLGLDIFPVANADVELSGASRATVNLDGRLDADLSGASRLSYMGEPTMGDIHTSGGSTLSKK